MIQDFINANYIEPLCKYYTPIGSITYGIILVLVVIGVYKLLQKLKVRIDKRFVIGLLPFIIYGGWTRALRDYSLGIYQSNLFCSPPIYFFIFTVALASLLLGLFIEKRTKFGYHKTMVIIGAILLLYDLSLTTINNYFAFGFILLLIGIWSLIFFGIHKIKPKILPLENAGIIVSHLFDASSTFTVLQFFSYLGYYEQHPLPNFLISIVGPWVMFPLKIIVVWTVLYAIDKYSKDKFFNNFLKIIILILGLALGLRDFLTISMNPI